MHFRLCTFPHNRERYHREPSPQVCRAPAPRGDSSLSTGGLKDACCVVKELVVLVLQPRVDGLAEPRAWVGHHTQARSLHHLRGVHQVVVELLQLLHRHSKAPRDLLERLCPCEHAVCVPDVDHLRGLREHQVIRVVQRRLHAVETPQPDPIHVEHRGQLLQLHVLLHHVPALGHHQVHLHNVLLPLRSRTRPASVLDPELQRRRVPAHVLPRRP
mmetsp:Transcript_34799/g.81940  ORF Transcript_34799/g.81940 Transcript_34799/m.81940 type:complete len:215 (+) Transcript_34799:77-721(+)